MKIAFVTMRYGDEVIGGAEAFCKIIAERMVKIWDIDVITTNSIDHFTWEKFYETGKSRLNRVSVMRFKIDHKKDLARLGALGQKLTEGKFTRKDELDWINTQGPISTPLFNYIRKNKNKYDCFFFWGYLFAHTYYGLPITAKKSILVPFIHDEAFFYFHVYDKIFNSPAGIIFQTPEEKSLMTKYRSHHTLNTRIIGTAIDKPKLEGELPKKYRIKDPYIIYVGRVEPAKGVINLANMFINYKSRNPGPLKLILLGNQNNELPKNEDIVNLGPVFGADKFLLISQSLALINPSPYESFSLVIAEAWLSGVPTLVNGKCAVLKGQNMRANAGLWYEDQDEFITMLDFLLENKSLRDEMAENGRKYIHKNYSWSTIEKKYEEVLGKIRRNKALKN